MTTVRNRAVAAALAALLTCSLWLGVAAPVAAAGVLTGDGGSLADGLGLDETVDDAVDGANASLDGRAVANGTATNGTAANGTADGTNDTGAVEAVGETVEGVGDGVSTAVNGTTNATGEAVDGTVNATGEAVDGTTNATGETVRGTTNATGEAVENATGDVTGTVDDVAGASTNTTTGVAETVDRTASSTTGAVGNVTAADTDANLTAVVDGTGSLVRGTTDGLTDAVDGTADGTDALLDGVVDGTLGRGEDPEADEAHGWPTEGSGSPAGQAGGAWTDAGADGPTAERADLDERAAAPDGEESGTAADGADGGALPPRGPFDPDGGGAAVGAALVVGSLVATRTGTAASSMGAGATALPRTLFALFREFLLRLAVLAGYSRYDFEDPLENENRAAILETVETTPGINLTSLVEATGLAESTIRYHLRVLEHEDLLEGAKVRGRRRYVPRAADDVELVAALEEEATKDVLEALFEHEPATGTALAEALDRDTSTVSHHLSRLSEAGLVEREQDGPALRNSLVPEVRRAFSEVEVTSSVQGHAGADD